MDLKKKNALNKIKNNKMKKLQNPAPPWLHHKKRQS